MAHGKERSSLFKFFYTVLKVITFPIFAVLYVLKHPLWVASLLFVLFCLAIYYPLKNGVKLEGVPEWYMKKFTEVKYEAGKALKDEGVELFSDDKLDELADEIEADKGLKGENYNAKVSRDKTMDEVASGLKKRGGFKRKGNPAAAAEETPKAEEPAASGIENVSAGGLEAVLGTAAETSKPDVQPEKAESGVSESKPVLPSPEPAAQPAPAHNAENPAEDEFDLF